jgi:hypothetical protein
MNSLTDLEYRILDELYFVSSFQTLLDNLNEEKNLVFNSLKNLLENGLVIQMKYGEGRERKLEIADLTTLEQSHFVASRKGLLIHNSRN